MSTALQLNNNTNKLDMFDALEKAYRVADLMSKSDIIPVHFRGKPANIFIVLNTAYRMNLDPMLVMQNTFVISGKLGMNTSFAISLANRSGLFAQGIRYRLQGSSSDLEVTAYTNLAGTGEEISYTITMKEAAAEGWTKNPKYQSLPSLMLRYRAAMFLIRTHAPEVINGMHAVEELEDVKVATKDVTPEYSFVNNDEGQTDINVDIDYSNVLKELCKSHNISVKEFASMYDISASDQLSMKRGVENFEEYLADISLKKNVGTESLLNELQEKAA